MANETDATVQRIDIKVSANTGRAQTAIEKLTRKLTELQTAVSGGFNLPDADTLNAFVNAMHALKGVHWKTIANGISSVAAAMSGLKGNANAAQQLANIQNVANGKQAGGAIDAGSTQLPGSTDFAATGFAAMEGKLRELGDAAVQVGKTIAGGVAPIVEKLEPAFNRVASAAATAFNTAKSAVESFANSVSQHVMPVVSVIGGTLGAAVTRARDAIAGFAYSVGTSLVGVMTKAAMAVSGFANNIWTKVAPAATAVGKQLKGLVDVGIAVGNVFVKTTAVTAAFAITLTSKVLSAAYSVTKALGKLAVSVGGLLATGIKKAAGAVGSLVKGIGSDLYTASQRGAIGVGKLMASIAVAPFRSAIKGIAQATGKLTGFLAALKRIALYRAIRFVLKEITQAFKEGTSNLYQYSLAINGTFAKSMDMLATSALYAKNSLAAMVAPLINQLAPAVDYLTDKFVDLMNTINELFATMTGASTWTKALKYPKAYEEAADGANGKAKELRATLLGFDEINRLDDNRRGSRGSAAEQLDYSKMFEEQVTTSRLSGIVSKLKEAFTSGDFTEIGRAVGEKLKKGLDSIPWGDIQERVRKNATSVATAINGFVSVPGLAESIGKTIAEAFNTVTTKISTFFTTVEWDKVGTFVGTSINTAIENINFIDLGRSIYSVIKGALTFAKSLLGTINWQSVGKKIGEFLNGIDFADVLTDLGETLSELIGDAIDLAWETIKTSPVAGTVAIAFLGLKFGSILGANLGAGVAASGLTGTIQKLIPTAATIAITAVVGYKIGNKIWDSFSEEFKEELADTMGAIDDFFGDVLGLESEAYKLNKHNWEAAKDLAAGYYEKAKEGEIQHQWLLNKGYSEETTHRAMQLKASMEQIDKQQELRKTMGWQTDELTLQMERQRMLSKYTDDEIKAWMDLTKETVKINFEAVFGSWTDLTNKVKEGFNKAKSTVKETFTGIGKTLGGWINDALGIDVTVNATKGTSGTLKDSKFSAKVYTYAGGGDVTTGSLFIAGEAGAEIVSSAGNRTTVSNRDQIAESVAIGNEEGNELLRELLSVGKSILAKDTNVVATITTGQITSALNRANTRSGSTIVPVG